MDEVNVVIEGNVTVSIEDGINISHGGGEAQPVNYTVYEALLTQTSANAPTAILFPDNTVTGITYRYNDEGDFSILSDGLFTLNKTAVMFGSGFNPTFSGLYPLIGTIRINANEIKLYTGDVILQAVTNGLLKDTYIKIIINN